MRVLAAAAILFASTAAEAAQVAVRIGERVAPDEAARLVSAIRGQVSDAASVETGASDGAACVVDLERTDEGIVVRMFDGDGHAAGSPRVVTQEGELGASEVGAIVHAYVVAALTASPEPRPSLELLPAPVMPPAPAAKEKPLAIREEPISRARIGAFYTGSTYASRLPWQSGARIEAAYAFRPGFYGGIGYAYHPTRDVDGPGATVSVSRHAASAFAGLERGTSFVVGIDAGIGIDQTVRSTARTTPALRATGEAMNIGPTFALRVHGRWRPLGGGGLGFDLAPTFELAPAARSMIVAGPEPVVVLAPTTARLRLDIGGTFDGF